MVRCQRCRLDCVETDGPLSGGGDGREPTLCPVCRLERSSPDVTLPPAIYRRARLLLGFETSATVRSRLVDAVEPETAPESVAGGAATTLRVDRLRRIGRVLGLQAQEAEQLTARELRQYVVDAADVDDSPASSFRKETLVEVTVHVADAVAPTADRGTDGEHRSPDSREEFDLSP
ncbi:hypothetical protein SAMN04487948_105369 [Halogranum amylolyticum]|uniref:Uncharacterized protein n=1 Tax=Halogranum amylolyticum TaxID=660520 RepID=A0A1H8SXH8_9EURY|nr:hypothetical protein [Halogranum amylolyticum]SEO83048.1 hypothetical protein SAMN04487948_105369 [Halogranum amylolyticum]